MLQKQKDHFWQLYKKIRLLHRIEPVNLLEEREKFFKSKAYNPRFIYSKPEINLDDLENKISKIKFDSSLPLGAIYNCKKEESLKKIQLIKAVGNAGEFTKRSINLFGRPEEKYLKIARERIKKVKIPEDKSEILQEKEIKEEIEKVLQSYGLDWDVKLMQGQVADFRVGKKSSVSIKKGLQISLARLQSTIIHELEIHILRAENSKQQPDVIFNKGFPNYLGTEEGLASYNQQIFCRTPTYLDVGRHLTYLGQYFGYRGSFRDCFNFLVDNYHPLARAWTMATSLKRGLKDTSHPGGFTKEFIYFQGMIKVDEFVKNGGDLKDLYLGKIGLNDLDLVGKIKGVQKPKILPRFL